MAKPVRHGGKPVKAPEKEGATAKVPSPGFAAVMLVDWAFKRFGAPGAVFAAIVLCVEIFAKDDTKDLIVREIFFHETTHGHYIQGFFVVLFGLMVVDVRLIARYLSGERSELKRVAAEKSRLQAERLGNVTTSSEVEQ
jgi:hypothetical protein